VVFPEPRILVGVVVAQVELEAATVEILPVLLAARV
jgi:hypothetical protein